MLSYKICTKCAVNCCFFVYGLSHMHVFVFIVDQVPVEVYAQHCHKRVEKMTQSGAKKGVKKPTIEEIKHAKVDHTSACYH